VNTIYCYSTETYLEYRGWIKVGQTKHADSTIRIKQQDGTSNPERLIPLLETHTKYTDHEVHAQLKDMGFEEVRQDADREWFECTIDDVKRAINILQYGINRKNNYSMRQEQQECCDKAVNWFQNEGNRFLINAKPRFGKTFTSYQIAKALGSSKVLVLTHKPAVEDSWEADLNDHVDFNNFAWHVAKNGVAAFKVNTQVVFSSMQQLLNAKGRNKVKWLFDQEWDLIVFDEEHYGSRTDNTEKILKKLTYTYRLDLSGTPFKAINSGLFLDDQRYDWTYIDEQLKRKHEESGGWSTEIYRSLPPMNFHTFNVHPDVVSQAEKSGFTGDDAFRIEKFFAAKDGQFEYPMLVKLFLDTLSRRTKGSCYSPWHSNAKNATSLLDHCLMILPSSVDAVRAYCKMLREHSFFSQYEIINAAGQGEDSVTDIDKVKKAIKRHDKTITISCGRFNTGVTVPPWGAVFMMDGGKSPETYIQTIFRVQSPYVERDSNTGKVVKYRKENCLVFDFNPQRMLELIYEYCETTAPKTQSTKETLRQFFEVASIMEHGENQFVEKSVEDVLGAVLRTNRYIERFGSARGVNVNQVDEKILENWADIKGNPAKLVAQLIDNQMERGRISQNLTPTEKKKAKEAKSLAKQLQEKAQTVLKRVPAYLFVSESNIESCGDIINNNDDLFKEVTNCSVKMFEYAIESKFLNEGWINRCIEDFRLREAGITLDNFLNGEQA
jgi:superfamily II DNA or RNA helicase